MSQIFQNRPESTIRYYRNTLIDVRRWGRVRGTERRGSRRWAEVRYRGLTIIFTHSLLSLTRIRTPPCKQKTNKTSRCSLRGPIGESNTRPLHLSGTTTTFGSPFLSRRSGVAWLTAGIFWNSHFAPARCAERGYIYNCQLG